MDTNLRLQRLRRQRNAATLFAVVLVLAAMGLTLPKSMAGYRALRASQVELLDLQRRITEAQAQIVAEQTEIVQLQQQMTALRKGNR